MITGEDTGTVRAIERLLKSTIERRTVEGFDYNVAAPSRDVEFARPPRQSTQRRKPAGDGATGSRGVASRPKAPGSRGAASYAPASRPRRPGSRTGN
jgi:ATP-dependent RNA helicase RhlE